MIGPRQLVVGIGGSAGGLDALKVLLAELGPELGFALVYVSHVPEQQASLLPTALAHDTSLPVVVVEGEVEVEAEHLYVPQPGHAITIADGVLRARPFSNDTERRCPIDTFFASLGRDRGPTSAGVVLSGAGADGTLGLEVIAERGGLTVAQEESTASAIAMPRHATVSGAADHVLPPREVAALLTSYAEHLRHSGDGESPASTQIEERLTEICRLLRQRTGHDFQHYKSSTLVRRIARRMQLLRLDEIEAYLDVLHRQADEVDTLFRTLLVGVTAFFRDPDVFDTLAELCLTPLLRARRSDDPLRIWVPGCATGEEVYSIAILVRELMASTQRWVPVQIFGTDIDERALAVARRGVFPATGIDRLPPDRVERCFVRQGEGYRIAKAVREMCLFSMHNLISDPPFSRLDLISCRNLLIYLGPHLQKKLLPVFHYALRRGGYLLLGPSENMATHGELFRPVMPSHRLFQRRDAAISASAAVPLSPMSQAATGDGQQERGHSDLGQIAQRIILDEFAPIYAVVDEEGEVIHLSTNAGRYLEPPPGPPTNNAIRMARPGLRSSLRAALHEAVQTRRRAVSEHGEITVPDGTQRVVVTVQPMPSLGAEGALFLVLFQDIGAPTTTGEIVAAADLEVIEKLERQLYTTRVELERTVQRLEVSNEELKSSNEELLSMNEELHSANEELETSKEEVQATNRALEEAKADLENLLASSRVATIFLDPAGIIRRFTPAAADIYNLLPGDLGRPLTHITHNARRMPGLPSAEEVGDGAVEDEITTLEGRVFLRRVLPYQADGRREGLVVTFLDVTAVRESEGRLRETIDAVPVLVSYVDREERYRFFNATYREWLGIADDQRRPLTIREVMGEEIYPQVEPRVRRVLAGERVDFEFRIRRRDGADGGQQRTILVSYVPRSSGGAVEGFYVVGVDISDRKQAEVALRAANESLEEAARQKDHFLAMLAHELRNPLAPIRNAAEILERVAHLEARQGRAVGIIKRQLHHLARLVDDLLDVSRIAQGKIQLKREPVDAVALVREVVDDHRGAFERGQIELVVELSDRPLVVHADRTRICQVVDNLLSNALKFTDRGGTVWVAAGAVDGTFELRVRDTGVGIVPSQLARIFDPFHQADDSLDRSNGGLGLGLSLVQGLIALHGGRVNARSDGAGAGTEFLVRLPLSEQPLAVHAPRPAREPDRQPRRVLVVEDNLDAAETMREVLELVGHEVRLAADGTQAVAVAREFRPDIVLCDIGLPGALSGYDVARTLRDDPALRPARLVALTGYGQATDRQRSAAAGFDHHIVKPVDIDELERVCSLTLETET